LIYHDGVSARLVAVVLGAFLLGACASMRPPLEIRTTQGPTAREVWMLRMMGQLGREPNFDETRHFDDQMEARIAEYLRAHPEDANSLTVSTFRFYRQTAVGMSKEQVLILLGAPAYVFTDDADMEKIARKFWPALKGNVTEAWVYPIGWSLYFAGQRLADITRYVEGAGGSPD
jgi:hypothetical protein